MRITRIQLLMNPSHPPDSVRREDPGIERVLQGLIFTVDIVELANIIPRIFGDHVVEIVKQHLARLDIRILVEYPFTIFQFIKKQIPCHAEVVDLPGIVLSKVDNLILQ